MSWSRSFGMIWCIIRIAYIIVHQWSRAMGRQVNSDHKTLVGSSKTNAVKFLWLGWKSTQTPSLRRVCVRKILCNLRHQKVAFWSVKTELVINHEQEIVRHSKGYLNFNCFEMDNFPLQGFLVAKKNAASCINTMSSTCDNESRRKSLSGIFLAFFCRRIGVFCGKVLVLVLMLMLIRMLLLMFMP